MGRMGVDRQTGTASRVRGRGYANGRRWMGTRRAAPWGATVRSQALPGDTLRVDARMTVRLLPAGEANPEDRGLVDVHVLFAGPLSWQAAVAAAVAAPSTWYDVFGWLVADVAPVAVDPILCHPRAYRPMLRTPAPAATAGRPSSRRLTAKRHLVHPGIQMLLDTDTGDDPDSPGPAAACLFVGVHPASTTPADAPGPPPSAEQLQARLTDHLSALARRLRTRLPALVVREVTPVERAQVPSPVARRTRGRLAASLLTWVTKAHTHRWHSWRQSSTASPPRLWRSPSGQRAALPARPPCTPHGGVHSKRTTTPRCPLQRGRRRCQSRGATWACTSAYWTPCGGRRWHCCS
jgi:hypothetical protein